MLNFKKYKLDTNGNVAMMFAVTTVMILTGVGAAVDYSNMTRARSALQSQVDAGVLAAATVEIERKKNGKYKQEKKTRRQAAREVVAANGFDLKGIKPELTINEKSVVLKAEVDYKPFFGGLLGVDKIRLEATAESGLPGKEGVDIVLVLDNTRSMEVDGKMQALEDGAVKLVEAIEASDSGTKIGVVPFARYVRVADSARTASWFDMPAEYDTPRTWTQTNRTEGTCTTETRTRTVDGVEQEYEHRSCTGQEVTGTEERSTTIESRWEGCVGTRLPPFSERDGDYGNRIPGLLNKVTKEKSGLSWDVDSWCPAEIVPMTDNYEDLKTKIRGMWTTDNTYLPTGLIWGQRVISPGEPYDNSPKAGEPVNRKVMVLMTDGENTTEIVQDSTAESEYRAPPYISNGNGDVMTESNAATARLCESIKHEGIEIFTIAFQVTDNKTKKMLRKCASKNKNAMTADNNAALIARFETIATALEADIRLMR